MIHNASAAQDPAEGTARAARTEETIDLGGLLSALWRGKGWIAAITALCIGLGGYYALGVATPLYSSTSVVMLDQREPAMPGLDGLVGTITGLGGSSQTVGTEVEVLRGRALLTKVVQRLNLDADPEFNSHLHEPGLVKTLVSGAKDGLAALFGAGQEPALPEDEQRKRILDDTVTALLKKMYVRNISNSLVFEISINTTDPVKSSRIVDTIADEYITDQLAVKLEGTERATAWLSDRVAELQIELETSQTRLQAFRSSTEVIDETTLLALDRQAKDLRERISTAQESLDDAKRHLQALDAAQGRDAQAAVAGDATLDRLLASIKRGGSTDADAQFDQRYGQLAARAETEQARAEAQIGSLQAGLAGLEASIKSQSSDLITMQQLEREAESNRLLYEYLLTQMKQAQVQQGIQQPDSRVLSNGVVPQEAAEPKVPLVLVISALLGMILGSGLVLLREARTSVFRTAQDLEQATGRTVLGQIPLISGRERGDVLGYLSAKPTSAAAEAVRNLRTSVLLSNIDAPPKVIVTTSALPGEGKTTTALSLAQNLTLMGKKVLLVEGDIRRRVFGEYFKIDRTEGLVSVLTGERRLDEVVAHEPRLGDVLIAEKTKINAADLYSSDAYGRFIDEVRDLYDVVIIDTPPVLVVPDVRVIGQKADAILFAVRWDATTRAQVADAMHMFETVNLRVTGLVLNQIDPVGMKRYGLADSHGAYAAYGSKYYGE